MFFLRVRRVHQAPRVEHAGEAAADPELALDLEPRAVQAEHVLDDRKAEPGAAARARARGRDAIEALGDPRQVLRRDALAGIGHGELGAVAARRPPDLDAPAGRRV